MEMISFEIIVVNFPFEIKKLVIGISNKKKFKPNQKKKEKFVQNRIQNENKIDDGKWKCNEEISIAKKMKRKIKRIRRKHKYKEPKGIRMIRKIWRKQK